jgi:DNA-binding CsgD family transcriptional regulator/tetratricopeptide (TPR) repeat protein
MMAPSTIHPRPAAEDGAGVITLPQRVSSPELVGRVAQLTALVDALEDTAQGAFAAVFLAGDSGVGKSRLLRELERAADARGARVLAGECIPMAEGELPYAPIRAALRGLGSDFDPAAIDVPASSEPLAQVRLFERVLELLAELGEEGPVLLAVEDIQWADRSTLDLLAFLMANARNEPLLLACSYRTDELHRRHPLRAFLAHHERRREVRRIDVPPFTRAELAAQIEAIRGAAPAEDLVARLYERTEGNAFFTEELLAAPGHAYRLPMSLREALLLRMEGLGPLAQHLIRVVAVHGAPVTDRLLAAATGTPDETLHPALREAMAGHVLVRRDVETYALRHALLAEALESDLLPGERTSLHLALAGALEADPTLLSRDGRTAAQLSAHWLGGHRLPEALSAGVRAAAEAEEVFAYAEASHHLVRALELWDQVEDPVERAGMDEARLYARAAEDAHLAVEGPVAIQLVRAAIERVDAGRDPVRAALLRERLGHYLFLIAGDTGGAQRAYEDGLELLAGDEPRPEVARLLARLAQSQMLQGHAAAAVTSSERAIAVARAAGTQAEEAHALTTLGALVGLRGDRASGIAHLRSTLRITEEIGDVDGLLRAYLNLSEMIEQDGRVEEAAGIVLAGARRARASGARDSRMLLEGVAAMRLLKLGRLAEAGELTAGALELRPSLARLAQCASQARVALERGDVDEAERLVAEAESATPFAPGSTWVEPLASARVEVELLRGRPQDARRLAEEVLERTDEGEYVAYTARVHALGARASAVLAERARATGDRQAAAAEARRAAALLERLEARLAPEHWQGSPPPETLAHHATCRAEAERAAGRDDPEAWAAVARRWAELGFPLEESYARLREGESRLLAGDRDGAAATVMAALELAHACGAVALGQELERLARRGRLLPSPDRPAEAAGTEPERHGLTERELSVLELMAEGKTNREIGELLFMATKTASVHVSRIFTKLGAESRVEAATAAQRLGLVA